MIYRVFYSQMLRKRYFHNSLARKTLVNGYLAIIFSLVENSIYGHRKLIFESFAQFFKQSNIAFEEYFFLWIREKSESYLLSLALCFGNCLFIFMLNNSLKANAGTFDRFLNLFVILVLSYQNETTFSMSHLGKSKKPKPQPF